MPTTVLFDLKIEPLRSHHNRAGFACGVEGLDRSFETQAKQDVKRKINGVFVWSSAQPAEVLRLLHLVCNRARARGCTSGCPQARTTLSFRRATLVGRSHRRPSTKRGGIRRTPLAIRCGGLTRVQVLWIFHAHRRRHQQSRPLPSYEANGFVRLPNIS